MAEQNNKGTEAAGSEGKKKPQDLAAENEKLRARLAELEASQVAESDEFAELVRLKVKAGLREDQAREVVKAQLENDARLAAKAKG